MSALPPPELFDRIYRRHGHRCPMSTLGGRLGWAALRALAGAGEVRGVYFIETCALDGIRETTGCHGAALRVENRGEHRLHLACGEGGVAVALTAEALAVAGRYRLCSEGLERDRPHLPAADLVSREEEKERVLQSVLEELWSLPDGVLLSLRPLAPEEISHA